MAYNAKTTPDPIEKIRFKVGTLLVVRIGVCVPFAPLASFAIDGSVDLDAFVLRSHRAGVDWLDYFWKSAIVGKFNLEENSMSKWKNWIVALAVSLAGTAAWGQALVTQGSQEIGIAGGMDFFSGAGTAFDLDVKYAYFFWDRASLGTQIGMSFDKDMTAVSLGVTGEYNFSLPYGYEPLVGTDLVPYVGGLVDYRYIDYFRSENAFVFGLEGGLKFFLTDSTAVVLALATEVATEDIYLDDDELTNWDLGLKLGMRFYF
jgi:hypothetical protein